MPPPEAAKGLSTEVEAVGQLVETNPHAKTTRLGKAFAHGLEATEQAKVAYVASASPTYEMACPPMEHPLLPSPARFLEAGQQSMGPFAQQTEPA